MKKFLKQSINKFLALGSFFLASIGFCLSVGMVYGFGYLLWTELKSNPIDMIGIYVLIGIIVLLVSVSLLIGYTPTLFKYGLRKIKEK
jgi:hypothetical protein